MSADFAYFLGLMATDGCVRECGYTSFVSLDECSVSFVRDFVSPSAPIRREATKAGNSAFRWSIWSVTLVQLLATYGIHPRKSLTIPFPDQAIPEPMMWDYLRGVLDGDGCVDKKGRVSFASGSAAFALGLLGFFSAHGWNASLYEGRRCWQVGLNVRSSREFGNRIYRADCPHLGRKRSRLYGHVLRVGRIRRPLGLRSLPPVAAVPAVLA
jgi:hypothetical protein